MADNTAEKIAAALSTGIVIGIVLLLFAGLGFVAAVETVDEGDRGVLKHQGAVTGDVLEPGWHVIIPFVQSAEHVEVRPQTFTMSGDPHEGDQETVDSVEFLSSDQQQVNVDVTVRYRVPADEVDTFHSRWNDLGQVQERLIRPVVEQQSQIRGASMDARTAVSDEGRESLARNIEEALVEEIGSELEIESVQVRDVHLDPSFVAELERVEVERTIAEQRVIEAEGEAQAAVVRAEGDAEAFEIRQQELTDEILMEQYINAIERGDLVIVATDGEGTPVILNQDD